MCSLSISTDCSVIKMEFMYNLTGIDLGAYFAANTAANTSIFAIIILPTLILCILCALALFFADGINWKV